MIMTSSLPPVNHSCEPNVVFDLSSKDVLQWHLRAVRLIKPGDPCESQDTSVLAVYRRNDPSDILLPEHRVEDGSAIRLPLRLDGTADLLPSPVQTSYRLSA